jgi:hypothetical protein
MMYHTYSQRAMTSLQIQQTTNNQQCKTNNDQLPIEKCAINNWITSKLQFAIRQKLTTNSQ